jgi:hypothetical protein
MTKSSATCVRVGCSNPGIYSSAEGQRIPRHFCAEHLWDKTPVTDNEHTCDMLGANPPSTDRCGRPAVVKWTNATDGRTLYWCQRCERKHHPTEAEKAEDARRELESAKTFELRNTFVLTPIGWATGLGLLALAVYGVILFIHWCWRNS